MKNNPFQSLFIAIILGVSTLLLPLGYTDIPVVEASSNSPATDPQLPGLAEGHSRYVVRFTDSLSSVAITALLEKYGAKQQRKYARAFNGGVLDMPAGQAKKLADSTSILWLEEDVPVRSTGDVTPSPSWGLDRLDQTDLPLDSTYSFANDGAGVTAYVVDTGIKIGHSQFIGRYRNGYDAFGQTGDDCNGHGTHVGGILGGSTYGVAPATSLVSVRVLDCNGTGTLSGVISGIEWAISDHVSGPAVMNLSFGTTQSASLESAVDRAFADGITIVAAAGNSNTDACSVSPAGDKASALTVGATNSNDSRASFSNYGTCVDLFAPGVEIASADYRNDSAPAVFSGTSMAAPHVAGLAARLLSINAIASPSDIMKLIINAASTDKLTSVGTGSPNKIAFADGFVVPSVPSTTITPPSDIFSPTGKPGTGNISNPTKPGTPSALVVLAGSLAAWAEWSDADDGGLPITGHLVRVYLKGVLVDQVFVDADTIHVIYGLKQSASYSFTVAAINGLGVSPFSPLSNSIIPVESVAAYTAPSQTNSAEILPHTPTNVKLKRKGKYLSIRWTPPANALVSTFEVRIYKFGKLFVKIFTPSSGGVKISGLKRGTYAVHITATNMAGSSEHSPRKTVRL